MDIIKAIGSAIFGDRVRRFYQRKDARQDLADQIAIALLEYERQVVSVRLTLRNRAARRIFAELGESPYAQRLEPPGRLLEMLSPENLPHGVPAFEALRAIFDGLKMNSDLAQLVLERGVGQHFDDAAADELLSFTERLLEAIHWAYDELRAVVSTHVKERLDPQHVGQTQVVEEIIAKATPGARDNQS